MTRAQHEVALKKRTQRVIAALTSEQFAYSVKVSDRIFDVYYFEKDGKPGSIALRIAEGIDGNVAEIAAFCAGRLSKDDMFDHISKGIN